MSRTVSSWLLLGSVAVLTACSSETPPPATAPSVPAAAASSPAEAEPTPAPPSADAPPRPAGKRAPCVLGQDQTCNGDPSVSALWGTCLPSGVCECKPGFVLAPTGYCQPATE